jgi:hypothetical protein
MSRPSLGKLIRAAAVLAMTGRIAEAQGFSISPGWVCDGDQVTIRWSGDPGAKLSAGWSSPAGTGSSPFATNELSRQIKGTTVFNLSAVRDTVRQTLVDTVAVHPPTMEHNWQRPSSCAGRFSTSSMAIPPARASDGIRPRSVTNHGTQPVLLLHRGRFVRLLPGESTTAFNDVPFSGDWGATVDTGPYNLSCPARPETTPPPIHIVIITGCGDR